MTKAATLTLTDFLLARIAEDEAEARGYLADMEAHPPSAYDMVQVGWIDAGSPERVLAECEAKRRIVDHHRWRPSPGMECDGHPGSYMPHGDYGIGYCMYQRDHDGETSEDLRAIAGVYADHPDYRDEWRP